MTNGANGASWIQSEMDTLHGQMAALQAALESSKHAVAAFHRRAAANLEASEQRYRDLFDNVLTGVYRMAPDGSLLLANPALVRMLGYDSLGELTRQRLKPPARLAADRAQGFERTWNTRDGGLITVRESCHVVRDESGSVMYFEGVVEDITGQKNAELFDRDCRAVLEHVARNEPLGRVFLEVTRMVERQIPNGHCCVMLLRDNILHPVSGPTLPGGYLDALSRGVPVAPGRGSNACAVRSGDIAVAEDIQADPDWREWRGAALANHISACWSVPIRPGQGAVLGTIAVYHQQSKSPTHAEVQILETTSRLAALAIEHRHLCDDLAWQARRDRLTGLPNRLWFDERLSARMATLSESDDGCAVLWIDLDRFKEINDTLGHQVGDELIRLAGARLNEVFGPKALFARAGGDEFAVAVCNRHNLSAAECAARAVKALNAPFHLGSFELFITASIGIALYPDHGRTAAELQQNAHAALHSVKNHGRNGFAVHEPALSKNARDRMELANNLRRAVERNELELHYQPQVTLSGEIRAFEALVRWNHPTRGLLFPGNFVPLAEETGLIVPIGTWVIEEACRQCAEWNAKRSEPLKMAVNVSTLQFYFSDLVEVVRAALAKSGLEPSNLELEVTESLVMKDAQQSAAALDRLRTLGVTIAIDDFGTGYSSLSYLRRLPVDLLKIDRSFFENVDSASASAIIQAITALAHALGLQVIAEGIEKHDQMSAIRRLGIDMAQGYLIGRPMPPGRVVELQRIDSTCFGAADPALA